MHVPHSHLDSFVAHQFRDCTDVDSGHCKLAGKHYAEALRGVLNCGYRRGGVASICVGKGTDIEARDFSTFCAKALAGIGHLPDTVADRSIPIRLKRKAPGEGEVERFHERLVELAWNEN